MMKRPRIGRLAIGITLVPVATDLREDPVCISGDVVAGTVQRDEAGRTLRFAISNVGAAAGSPSVPVVVEGRIDPDGTFQAETLLAKCPSTYQAVGDPSASATAPRS